MFYLENLLYLSSVSDKYTKFCVKFIFFITLQVIDNESVRVKLESSVLM